ncbi:hypothetical protein M6C35_000984, partial [Vibrio metschnikovii]|nr:hypothetical protein [Vibrio metschnikovii]EKO3714831.1 hypothetical protein [Vibrio metschnikovii]EKO3738021.1 hypothetical protein [Vibrio metschnikovii]
LHVDLLHTCVENGFGTISITFHGIPDKNGNLQPSNNYPIKGVFPGAKTLEVIDRIKDFNLNHLPSGKQPIKINIGITIGSHNHTLETILSYCEIFNGVGINSLRFNCFTDHGKKHPHLQLSQEQVRKFYQDIKYVHDNIPCDFQIGISEDFGTNGIDVLGLPGHVGWCRAGRQLFAIVPSPIEKIGSVGEKIADIVGCVNIFEPYLGYLLRVPNIDGISYRYKVCFDENAIDNFTAKRLNGEFTNGCFAGEMLMDDRYHIPLVSEQAIEVLEVD